MPQYNRPSTQPVRGSRGGGGGGTEVYIEWIDEESGLARVRKAGGSPDQGFNPDSPDQGFNPDYPDQSLPGGPNRPGRPPHPGNRPPGSGPSRPTDPGFGHGRPDHPSHRPPWQGKPKPEWPPGPTDPNWGIDAPIDTPDHPAHLPGEPDGSIPEAPDHTLPPIDGHQPPPMEPGTIWPPLPPDAPTGKHAFLVWISGVGLRYGVFEIPQHDQSGSIDNSLPAGEDGAPAQPLPPGAPRPQPPQRPGAGVPRPPIGSGGNAPSQPIQPPGAPAGSNPTPQPLKR
jgi:hypothetical protein